MYPKSRAVRFALCGAVLLWLGCALDRPAAAQAGDILVFAAASLKNALDAATSTWSSDGDTNVRIVYAGSSTLAKQIEQGAPADIFVSANLQWMDYLAANGLIDPATRSNVAANRLVLIAPQESRTEMKIVPGFDLVGALDEGRLAMANTAAVPAGIYGRSALTSLGVWETVKGRIAQTPDVRAALALVSRGEAPLGIVYESDANADANVRTIGIFPEDSHAPIIYPVAVVSESKSTLAHSLVDYLRSDGAAEFFEEQGFSVPR